MARVRTVSTARRTTDGDALTADTDTDGSGKNSGAIGRLAVRTVRTAPADKPES
jgi:hypothetical protein